MYLSGYEAVGLYTNLLALLLMLALLTLSQRLVSAEHGEDKLFLYLCIPVTISAVFGVVFHLTRALRPSFMDGLLLISASGGTYFAIMTLLVWILYVDYKCNGSKDHLKRRYSFFLGAFWAAYTILLVVNLFTGIVFHIDDELEFSASPFYTVLVACGVLLFLLSCAIFVFYRKNRSRGKLFRISPIIVPVVTSVIAEQVLFDAIEPLGFTVALIFLYFSLIESWQYEAGDAGVYNRAYLTHLAEEITAGRSDIQSAIVIESENSIGSDFTQMLKNELPEDADLVHVSKQKFVYFTSKKSKKALTAMCVILEYAGAEYDEAHPDLPLHISCPYDIWDGENAQKWITKVCC